MPSIPQYNAQRNVTNNPGAPLMNEAAQNAQANNNALNVVQQISQRWSDANDTMQSTDAKAKYEVAVAEIENRAANDPDFKNSAAYIKELDTAKKNSLSGVDNQEIANLMSIDFTANNRIAALRIENGFRAKQMEYNKVQVKTSIDNLQRQRLNAATDQQKEFYDKQIGFMLKKNVAAGLLSYDEADKFLRDSQSDGVKFDVYADHATTEKDSQVLKDLKDPNGKYAFLPPDERLSLIQESQRRIFQNNQTYKRADEDGKDARFNNIFQKVNEGTLTLADLDAEQKAYEAGALGALDQKEILDIRKGLQGRIKTDLEAIKDSNEKAEEYQIFIDNFIDDETDRQKGRELIVNSFKDGILSPKEASLLNSLKRETESIKQIKDREAFMDNPFVPFKNAINAINDKFTGMKNFTESEKAMAIKKLLNSSTNNVNPMDISTQIINDAIIQKNPSILNLSEEGQLVIDENGHLRMMNNKVEVTEIKEKTESKPKKPAKK